VVALERISGRHNLAAKLQELPAAEKLSVFRGTGIASRDLGTADLNLSGVAYAKLPFGMPRFINAATMKKMLKAKRSELLFKRWASVGRSVRTRSGSISPTTPWSSGSEWCRFSRERHQRMTTCQTRSNSSFGFWAYLRRS
jgi:hypothetical protein